MEKSPDQVRQDTIDVLGDSIGNAEYITQEFIVDVLRNPVEHDWDEDLPESGEEDAAFLLTASPGQSPRRAWVYRPVKIGDKWAFYWWKQGDCSSLSGFRNFDSWEKNQYILFRNRRRSLPRKVVGVGGQAVIRGDSSLLAAH